MPSNKPFTPEEDRVIIYLYDELKIKQWSLVCKKMTEDYKMERNAKQCRDRYRQVLDPNSTPEWTDQEEKRLYELHNTVGNKWALIASYFPGKTDNYVKNYFYSKLRKALRHLNRVIKTNFKKEFKEIKIAALYKIVEGFEEQFKENPIITQEVSNECCHLKDALINIADEIQETEALEENHLARERYLIEKIYEFNRTYKKKSKKEKRDSLQVQQLFKPAKKIELFVKQEPAGEDSDFEVVNSVASSDSQDNENEMRDVYEPMKEEKDQLRRSPVFVIVKEDNLKDSHNSTKSKIEIRLSDLMSSSKVESQEIQQNDMIQSIGLSSSQKMECSFGFMRGQSSFRSYGSRSRSQTGKDSRMNMFGNMEEIRISPNLKDVCTEMQAEKDESLFRSQK